MNFKLDHSNDFIFYPEHFLVTLERLKKNRVCLITQPRSGSHLLLNLIHIKSPSLDPLATNTDQTLMKVFSFCGFESERTVTLADTKLKKMGNTETEAWVERFKKDYADYRNDLSILDDESD